MKDLLKDPNKEGQQAFLKDDKVIPKECSNEKPKRNLLSMILEMVKRLM